MLSPMLLPLKSSRSLPAWPSTVSLPSPGSHWKRSSPRAEERVVGALVAVDEVVAACRRGACRRRCRRARSSSPSPPSIVSAVSGASPVAADDRVRAAEPEHDEALDGGGVEPRRAGRERADLGAVGEHRDRVGDGRAVVPERCPRRRRRRRCRRPGRRPPRPVVIVSLAAERRDVDVVVRGLGAFDEHLRGEAVDGRRSRPASVKVTRSAPVRAPGDHGVGRAVAAAAERVRGRRRPS